MQNRISEIVLIVEGSGDREAVPLLLRRTFEHLSFYNLRIAPGIIELGDLRVALNLDNDKFDRYARYALQRQEGNCVLIVLDCDDHCARDVLPLLVGRLGSLHNPHGKKIGLCLFVREYECMFLARISDLYQAYPEIEWSRNFAVPEPADSVRDAKGVLREIMGGFAYKETIHQARFTSRINLSAACNDYRPYRHLIETIRWFVSDNQETIYPFRVG